MAVPDVDEAHISWVDGLVERHAFGQYDRGGTANYIDDGARRRAADAIVTGATVALSRSLTIGDEPRSYDGLLSVEVRQHQITTTMDGRPLVGGVVNTSSDTQTSAAHGLEKTHLDALNHYGRLGTWYSGFQVGAPDTPGIADLADHKLFTRGVVADIPAVRGTDWVDPDAPVTGDEIQASLDAAGVSFEPGDALLLYMGRDRFEEAGHRMTIAPGTSRPGAGAGAAAWIADNHASILCWDFLDAVCPSEPPFPVHLLIWAVGLLLVDNCNLRPAVDAMRTSGSAVGGLVIAPPPIPSATHCLVGPLFIQ